MRVDCPQALGRRIARCSPLAMRSEISCSTIFSPRATEACSSSTKLPRSVVITKSLKLTETAPLVTPHLHMCRGKMRMSGLCKVEMSGFIQGRRADGTGANRVEHERTGAAEGVTRSRARPSEAGGSGTASAIERPPGTALADAAANSGRWRDRAWVARPGLEPENSRGHGAARVARLAPGVLSGIRPHAGRRAPGAPGSLGQPRDAAEMDECRRIVAEPPPKTTAGARLATTTCGFRRTGADGQIALSLAGRARPGLPPGGPDR